MLAGMAVTFTGIATLAAVGGAWAVRVSQYGRAAALLLLTAFAATLLSRQMALSGPNAHTTTLLFAYAAGAATSLGVAIFGESHGADTDEEGAGVVKEQRLYQLIR